MLKITMRQFIIAFMQETGYTKFFVSEIQHAILHIAKIANIMLTDTFNSTSESILEVVVQYPEHFTLNSDCHSLLLKNPDSLSELASQWEIPKELKKAINKYVNDVDDVMMVCSNDIEHSEKNIETICKDTSYIHWIWDKLDNMLDLKTTDISLAKDNKELANIAKISNLFIILSRYYKANLMTPYGTENCEKYIFKYTRNNEERFFGVSHSVHEDNKIYRLSRCTKVDDAPYFPDVVLGVPCISLEKKHQMLKDFGELFEKAKNIDLNYDYIKDILDKVYGKNDNYD